MTEQEVTVSLQRHRTVYCKIQLMSYDYSILGELTGVVLSTPSFSIDASSDLRRSCSFSLTPTDKTFEFAENSKIWIDKYVKVFMGIVDERTDEIVYTNMGMYLINNPSRVYNATDNTITIQGIDLMAKLNGNRGGNMTGYTVTIPKGSNIKSAIEGLLIEFGFNDFVVEECDINSDDASIAGRTYEDIDISAGQSAYNILTQLRDIVPSYQMYFDVDGVFHYEKIPSGVNEPIMVDDEVWQKVLISYNESVSYENIYNYIEVYGKVHDVDNYATIDTIVGNTYYLTIPNFSSYNGKDNVETVINNSEAKMNEFITSITRNSNSLKALFSGYTGVQNRITTDTNSMVTTLRNMISTAKTRIVTYLNSIYSTTTLTVTTLNEMIDKCNNEYSDEVTNALDTAEDTYDNFVTYIEDRIEEVLTGANATNANKYVTLMSPSNSAYLFDSYAEEMFNSLTTLCDNFLSEITQYLEIGIYTKQDVSGTKYFRINHGLTYPLYSNFDTQTSPTFDTTEDHYYVSVFSTGVDYFTLERTGSTYESVATVDNKNMYTIGASVGTLTDGQVIYFKTPIDGNSASYYPQFRINNSDYYEAKKTDGTEWNGTLDSDTIYKLTFHLNSDDETHKYWRFYGDVAPSATVYEDNQESPFCVDKVGVLRIVLNGGTYDNYYTNEACEEIAQKELYDRCRMQDNITIDCVPLYWLDVNWVVQLTLPKKYAEDLEETKLYIIKSINTNSGYNGTQSITMMEYYPNYEYVYPN